ncbi:RNA-directed DNA polymerase, eukaryota, reverse transcriptase zinc-binding domain protein, partial [Tanacetum coccineum]
MEGCENTLASLVAGKGDETKMLHVDLWLLRQVWGNSNFDFASSSARGLSGGNVHDGIVMVMGDFNEVRVAGERFGSVFNDRQAKIFNEFILDASLIDIPLGGYNFTWSDKWGMKMSKLDRFLVSESFYEFFPHITGVVLEKGVPDHRPILLKESEVDYGPTPFCFFHSWLEMDGFQNLVIDTWKNDGIVEFNGLVLFKKKLQNLKQVIRKWVALKKSDSFKMKKEYQQRLSSIDAKVDQGLATKDDILLRKDSLTLLGEI